MLLASRCQMSAPDAFGSRDATTPSGQDGVPLHCCRPCCHCQGSPEPCWERQMWRAHVLPLDPRMLGQPLPPSHPLLSPPLPSTRLQRQSQRPAWRGHRVSSCSLVTCYYFFLRLTFYSFIVCDSSFPISQFNTPLNFSRMIKIPLIAHTRYSAAFRQLP